MRLIDADKLIEELGIEERCSECQYVDGIRCAGNFVDACMAIFDAPTVKAEDDAISRQAVLDIIQNCYDGGADPFVAGTICGDSVKALPPIQSAIIRCKECKHYRPMTDQDDLCAYRGMQVFPDDYCSRAERREDE